MPIKSGGYMAAGEKKLLTVPRGAMPMGLGTIITMLIYVAVPLSDGFVYFVQVLFWIDVVIAILCCFAIPMLMYIPRPSADPLQSQRRFFLSKLIRRIITHEQSIDKLTAVWLLPIVPPIVASGVGANLCMVIPQAAISPTLIASYVCWGIGVPFAMSILVLYIHRLTIYKVAIPRLISFNVNSYRRVKPASAHSFQLAPWGKEVPPSSNSGS
jgi:tellurite resistance protein TehA-like permease